ncbi:MAG: septal ring lytic transglycosylase RlpA family protein [Saprospiraceae bacterium]
MRPFFSFLLGLSVCLGLSSFILNRAEEFGKAGYYADALQGRKTASGEKYDKNVLTCAHKTYAFGTKLRVTRLDNKKSVIVRVNDRGPYTEGFVVDLSRAAAEEINLIKAGRANVKVEVVEPEKSSITEVPAARVPTAAASVERVTPKPTMAAGTSAKPRTQLLKARQKGAPAAAKPVTYSTEDPVPATSGKPKAATADANAPKTSELYKINLQKSLKTGFGIQVSTMYDADNVLPIVTKLQGKYPGKVLVSVEHDEANDQSTYRIILGPFPTRKAAEAQQKTVERKGNKGCFVVDLSAI